MLTIPRRFNAYDIYIYIYTNAFETKLRVNHTVQSVGGVVIKRGLPQLMFALVDDEEEKQSNWNVIQIIVGLITH